MIVTAKGAYVHHREHGSFKKDKVREELFRRNENIFYEIYERPKRFVFIVDKDNKPYYKFVEEKSYELVRKGYWVWVIKNNNLPELALKSHASIFYFSYKPKLYKLKVVLRILKRRKKKFNVIYVNSSEYEDIFNNLKFIHKAEVKKV